MDEWQRRIPVKKRWSEEETLLMAKKEACLISEGVSRGQLNKSLSLAFTERSLEAIKKKRQAGRYKELVHLFLEEIREGGSSSNACPAISEGTTGDTAPEYDDHLLDNSDGLLDYVLSLPDPEGEAYYSACLIDICRNARTRSKDDTYHRLSLYLLSIFPMPSSNIKGTSKKEDLVTPSKRKLRQLQYKSTQRNWVRHQSRCIKAILDGPSQAIMPKREIMEPYWRNVMVRERVQNNVSPVEPEIIRTSVRVKTSIWSPITPDEIKAHKLPLTTAPGPDGITGRQLRAIPLDILVRIFNLIMYCGKLPEHLGKAKTIFIAKGKESIEPGDFRPITIPSILTRLLHRILAKRLARVMALDDRQQAFRNTDGTSYNITLLDIMLRYNAARYKSLYLASLDISKAFDSVSHNTIFETMTMYGCPPCFVRYLSKFYETSKTSLVGDQWSSDYIRSTKGVRQGDPLSPMLFNMVIDRLLRSLPSEVGYDLLQTKINALAFADDIVLCASTKYGLEELLRVTQAKLTSFGLDVNTSKSVTLSLVGQPKYKNVILDKGQFRIGNTIIPHLTRTDEWKYLGIKFTPSGRCKFRPCDGVCPKLERLTKAPLKPQQRLHALRTVLIPQLYYKITLGSVQIGCLNKLDRLNRACVRKWLGLPNDCPNAYFHAPVEQGGLGIPSMRWFGPLLRRNMLLRIKNQISPDDINNILWSSEWSKVERRLKDNGVYLGSVHDINNLWSLRLHTSVDGYGLREANLHKQAHRWIREPTRLLSSKDYINCIKARINALPTKPRVARGRAQMDRNCRAGCRVPETLNHVVQVCPRTHNERIDRHNCVSRYIERALIQKGYNTIVEPSLPTSEGKRKPDIIATIRDEAYVIDAQVVTDSRSLDDAHIQKKGYYNTTELNNLIKAQFRVNSVHFLTATLNWRGIWSGMSINELITHSILRKTDSAIVSTRALIGTIRCHRVFHRRTGIG